MPLPLRTALLAGMSALAASVSIPAAAAEPCTGAPGEYQVGEQNGTPMCNRQPQAPGAPQQRPKTFHERAAEAHSAETNAAIADMFLAMLLYDDKQRIERELARDPVYQRMKAGYWEYATTPPGQPRGDGCSATYVNLDGAVTISGPRGDYRQAAITFWAGQIPPPKKPGMKAVTLSQTGGKPPATVQAYHFAMADGKLGAVTFVVPDAPALLAGMFDAHQFGVAFKKTPWITIAWTGGNAARSRLQSCLKAG